MTKEELSLKNKKCWAHGHKFELKIYHSIKPAALATVISSGSKGLFDVWSIHADKVRVIVSKKCGGYITPKEKKKLIRFYERKPDWVQVEIHYYLTKKKATKKIIKNIEQLIAWKGVR